MIIWLIGISGAGKTTLGRKLEDFYRGKGLRTYPLSYTHQTQPTIHRV